MRSRVVKFLDSLVEKNKMMSKFYVHSEFKKNKPHFDRKQPGYDTSEGLYTRYADVRRLALVKNLNEDTRKQVYMNYYKKEYRLSDYCMTLLNMNRNKLQMGNLPENFKEVIESENLELRKKILLLMDHPHLNKKLTEDFTFSMINRVNLDLMAPDVYSMSILKNKVQGERVYNDTIRNKSKSQNQNLASPAKEMKVAPSVPPKTQLTKEKLESIKKQRQQMNENVQKTNSKVGQEIMI